MKARTAGQRGHAQRPELLEFGQAFEQESAALAVDPAAALPQHHMVLGGEIGKKRRMLTGACDPVCRPFLGRCESQVDIAQSHAAATNGFGADDEMEKL